MVAPDGGDRQVRIPTPEAPLRIGVVDDNALFRRTLVRLIARQAVLQVVAEAASGAELDALLSSDPELLLLDLEVGDESGFVLLEHCHAVSPQLSVILLTGHDPSALQIPARDKGAQACWSKSDLRILLETLATQGAAPAPVLY
ncbi:MAG: DNA-binding response regulator [Gammaproteobacteria bacterium]|nr:MAG: DNA-binding response regulator [Gammaproteobacteria bacterium]